MYFIFSSVAPNAINMFPIGLVGFLLFVVLLLLLLYFKLFNNVSDDLPTLYYKESALNTFLFKKYSIFRRPFRQKFFLKNPHIQTLCSCLRPQPDIRFDREYLQMSDKGIIALDWVIYDKGLLKRSAPVLLLFPALHADGRSMTSLCCYASSKGFRVVVFNSRGHGNSFLTTKKLQCFGDPTDVRQTIVYIKQKHTKSSLVTLSVSSGSTELFSYLGEFGSSARIRASAFISPIYDTSEILTEGNIPRVYEFLFLAAMKRILLRHAASLYDVIDINSALKSWTIIKFLECVYSLLSGLDNMETFLEKNNPMRDVDDIATPVLCIHSRDDPVSLNEKIPYDLFNFYPNMLLVTTKRGGHCGFIENVSDPSWADRLAVDYLQSVLEFSSGRTDCIQ